MGFWSVVGELAEAAKNNGKQFVTDVQHYKEKYQYYSDSDLVDRAKNGSMAEKAAACHILKSRYGEDYKSHLH